ncbi:MAG: carboxypeptidase-like regulatory domain-containing protein [Bacteroidetes bacterium]|nr:carboxypeptidase-like regulatory domain-containing protein [Bacteroidota bacterium]
MRVIQLLITCVIPFSAFCQSYTLHGTITNAKLEPLAFASIQVKDSKMGTTTKEDGTYELELDAGKYDLIITLVGYKPLVTAVVVQKENREHHFILEIADAPNLSEVVVKTKNRDRGEEYVRNVIRHKDEIVAAAGDYSCKVYIKAVQQDSSSPKENKKPISDSLLKMQQRAAAMNAMAMAEIVLELDKGAGKKIKEERTGIKKRGNTADLFYLSTTEGDFSFYNNLISIRSIAETPFVSPISYSGLLAYRFKLLRTDTVNGRKQFVIAVKPRQLSNATVEGEVTIADSSWVLLHTQLKLPKYHLAAYDFFEVEQQYDYINDTAWMLVRQQFTYSATAAKRKASGITTVTYNNYALNKTFDKKYFGVEVSAATAAAYKRDSIFWNQNRTEPLTEKEIRFIYYKDSVYNATHTKAYLDSLDKKINTVTWQKLLYKGQEFNDHEKRRHWMLPAIPALYQPFQFGGTRIQPNVNYAKTWASRKNIDVFAEASYGLRNKDINGSVRVTRMYNPFNRGFYSLRLQKNFEFIFSGDAWINMISRNNLYLNKGLGVGHGLELLNGLYFFTDVDIAFRRSLTGYKTNDKVDSLFGNLLDSNHAVAFEPYNALYTSLRLEYTPHQHYIREPKEKIILGSTWPTFYALWRKGTPHLFNSAINFDYLELGIKQTMHLGTLGNSSYTIKTGSFLNTADLRLVDYKRERRGDPILFSNPNEAFQSLDSTFPVFKRFYEGHYVHEFNGALLNKIPVLKNIGLREIAGAGFLIAPERNNLRYIEVFTGIERVFKIPFNQLGKFKLGVYACGSAANNFHNPVQFKIGITSWDRKNGKWF